MFELAVFLILALCFLLPFVQGRILAGAGSDNSTHIFLINTLRQNNFRLFTRVPRIINESYCGAFPLALHAIIARFSLGVLPAISAVLNPLANATLCVIFAAFLVSAALADLGAIGITAALLLITFTPQVYYAFGARSFGISSRSIGIVLFCVFQIACFIALDQGYDPLWVGVACVVGYLVLAFNTFALQALLLTGAVQGIWVGSLAQLVIIAVSVGGYLAIHPAYGASYLKHTVMFLNTYRLFLADIFILANRFSIWRDLIRDIPEKFRNEGIRKGCSYAYGNSILILVFLNPLAVIGGLSGWVVDFPNPALEFCWQVSASGLAIFFATSFRRTRFLGEPERYVEIVTPFSVAAGVFAVTTALGPYAALVLIAYSVVVTLAQFLVASRLSNHVAGHWAGIRSLYDSIESKLGADHVRFGSNNDEVVKFALDRQWRFARHWSFEMPFAGLGVSAAFEVYPMMYPESFAKVVDAYQLNAVIIDKSSWDFEAPYSMQVLSRFEQVFEDSGHVAFVSGSTGMSGAPNARGSSSNATDVCR